MNIPVGLFAFCFCDCNEIFFHLNSKSPFCETSLLLGPLFHVMFGDTD